MYILRHAPAFRQKFKLDLSSNLTKNSETTGRQCETSLQARHLLMELILKITCSFELIFFMLQTCGEITFLSLTSADY